MISGIILCTVGSSAKGRYERLQKLEEDTFLRHIITVLHSARITDVVMVGDEEGNKTNRDLSVYGGKIFFNSIPNANELSSIRAGIENIPRDDLHGVIICPINHPFITQKLLVNLLQSFWHSKKNIIVPKYNSRRSYPLIFRVDIFDLFRTAPKGESVFEIIKKYENEIQEVDTTEEGIILSVTSLEDYKKYSGVINV